ncbi:hypothetical protein BDZ97DRAFT_238948 [Flammula alnicola]|nr:hypothetical protein BDZ97DRAFT_238948 [Flammula alnicola]
MIPPMQPQIVPPNLPSGSNKFQAAQEHIQYSKTTDAAQEPNREYLAHLASQSQPQHYVPSSSRQIRIPSDAQAPPTQVQANPKYYRKESTNPQYQRQPTTLNSRPIPRHSHHSLTSHEEIFSEIHPIHNCPDNLLINQEQTHHLKVSRVSWVPLAMTVKFNLKFNHLLGLLALYRHPRLRHPRKLVRTLVNLQRLPQLHCLELHNQDIRK